MNRQQIATHVSKRIFQYVKTNDQETWKEIQQIIKPHKIDSILRIFKNHLLNVEDISIFLKKSDSIPRFLLHFVKIIRRNFFQPGDPLGILLTCRITMKFTQQSLDSKHLKQLNKNTKVSTQKALYSEIYIFTNLTQISEILKSKIFNQILVENYTLNQLLNLIENACVPKICDDYKDDHTNYAETVEGSQVYYNLKPFLIIKSFIEGTHRIFYKKRINLAYLFKILDLRKIIALSDVKYVYKKCGISCYFFNFIKIIKYQFFKNPNENGVTFNDIVSIVRYQCCSGTPLPLNRNGLKKNPNKSSLQRICFEAVRQNLIDEAINQKEYQVKDSISRMFFGQNFIEGTGYTFSPVINSSF